jgi:hypothetical protein
MSIAYVAQTRDHLLMLNEEGICLHVQRRWKGQGNDACDGAIACIGAQYVAALDPKEPGYLAHSPTLGVPMLFAKINATGKIVIVRTGPLERFEHKNPDVFDRPSETTSPSIQYLAPEDLVEEEAPTLQFRRPGRTPRVTRSYVA